jgi:hypothetical protein
MPTADSASCCRCRGRGGAAGWQGQTGPRHVWPGRRWPLQTIFADERHAKPAWPWARCARVTQRGHARLSFDLTATAPRREKRPALPHQACVALTLPPLPPIARLATWPTKKPWPHLAAKA